MANKHRGEVVKARVDESPYTVAALAKKMGIKRTYIYTLYSRKDLEDSYINQIGKIIGHDFREDFKDLMIPSNQVEEEAQHYSKEKVTDIKDQLLELQTKHIELMQRHQLLLDKNFEEYFRKAV